MWTSPNNNTFLWCGQCIHLSFCAWPQGELVKVVMDSWLQETSGRSLLIRSSFDTMAASDVELLWRPCVTCGVFTAAYCDGDPSTTGSPCLILKFQPNDTWAPDQQTPFCSSCESRDKFCRYCKRSHNVPPAPWGSPKPKITGQEPVVYINGERFVFVRD